MRGVIQPFARFFLLRPISMLCTREGLAESEFKAIEKAITTAKEDKNTSESERKYLKAVTWYLTILQKHKTKQFYNVENGYDLAMQKLMQEKDYQALVLLKDDAEVGVAAKRLLSSLFNLLALKAPGNLPDRKAQIKRLCGQGQNEATEAFEPFDQLTIQVTLIGSGVEDVTEEQLEVLQRRLVDTPVAAEIKKIAAGNWITLFKFYKKKYDTTQDTQWLQKIRECLEQAKNYWPDSVIINNNMGIFYAGFWTYFDTEKIGNWASVFEVSSKKVTEEVTVADEGNGSGEELSTQDFVEDSVLDRAIDIFEKQHVVATQQGGSKKIVAPIYAAGARTEKLLKLLVTDIVSAEEIRYFAREIQGLLNDCHVIIKDPYDSKRQRFAYEPLDSKDPTKGIYLQFKQADAFLMGAVLACVMCVLDKETQQQTLDQSIQTVYTHLDAITELESRYNKTSSIFNDFRLHERQGLTPTQGRKQLVDEWITSIQQRYELDCTNKTKMSSGALLARVRDTGTSPPATSEQEQQDQEWEVVDNPPAPSVGS